MTEIGDHAFAWNQLTSVTIPHGVLSLSGFDYNTLKSVVIPDSVIEIGDWAFYGNSLSSVIIPSSVMLIGDYSFMHNDLTSVLISNNSVSIGSAAFNENQLPDSQAFFYSTPTDTETLVSYGGTSRAPVIPNGTTVIGPRAFSPRVLFWRDDLENDSTPLTSITIPNSVTLIMEHAFRENQLTSVTIPNSVTSIGDGAFTDNKLTSVVIPSSVTSLSYIAFRNNLLTDVRFLGAMPTLHWSTGANGVFGLNPTIPDGGIRVPVAHLTTYRNNASRLGVRTAQIVGE